MRLILIICCHEWNGAFAHVKERLCVVKTFSDYPSIPAYNLSIHCNIVLVHQGVAAGLSALLSHTLNKRSVVSATVQQPVSVKGHDPLSNPAIVSSTWFVLIKSNFHITIDDNTPE